MTVLQTELQQLGKNHKKHNILTMIHVAIERLYIDGWYYQLIHCGLDCNLGNTCNLG